MESERRKIGIVLAFVVLFATLAFVSVGCASGTTPPEEEWNKTFGGGVRGDYAHSVQQTAGGGYILAGEAWSYPAEFVDAWLGKIDSDGNAQWGWLISYAPHVIPREFDCAYSVQQTTDGGYIFAGSAQTYVAGHFGFYFWLVKTDPYGDIQWQKAFGPTGTAGGRSVQQTGDGGYILAGYKKANDPLHRDRCEAWLVKTYPNGNKQWDRTFTYTLFSDDKDVKAYSVQQTEDGGYILAGVIDRWGKPKAWLVKTNSYGNMQWEKTFGGSEYGEDNEAKSVQQTEDGGYILAGYTESYGAGGSDAWLLKTDPDGNELWNKTFGGPKYDSAKSVHQTEGGGYILAGSTGSYGAGSWDAWLLKTDSNGDEHWNKTFGGLKTDGAESVHQTEDGGYILAGYTHTYTNSTGSAIWLIKVKGKRTISIFDTEPSEHPYSSIMGTHKGEIKPSDNINVSKLYTYPCVGTGGHTESIELYDENDELIASGTWNGYQDDYHNISITPSVTLWAGHTYNYIIVTGSYTQIIHAKSKDVTGGTITCSSFVDANGKTYTDWIPAIRLE